MPPPGDTPLLAMPSRPAPAAPASTDDFFVLTPEKAAELNNGSNGDPILLEDYTANQLPRNADGTANENVFYRLPNEGSDAVTYYRASSLWQHFLSRRRVDYQYFVDPLRQGIRRQDWVALMNLFERPGSPNYMTDPEVNRLPFRRPWTLWPRPDPASGQSAADGGPPAVPAGGGGGGGGPDPATLQAMAAAALDENARLRLELRAMRNVSAAVQRERDRALRDTVELANEAEALQVELNQALDDLDTVRTERDAVTAERDELLNRTAASAGAQRAARNARRAAY